MSRILEEFLDFLIPVGQDNSISGSRVWNRLGKRTTIEHELLNFLEQKILNTEHTYEDALQLLEVSNPILCSSLTEALLEDYFEHPEVKTRLSQNHPAPFPIGYKLPSTDWSILEPVIVRSESTQKRK